MADRGLGLDPCAQVALPHSLEAALGRPLERDDLRFRHQFDVRRRRDPVDQIARHALGEARAPHQHAHLRNVGGQKDGALPGGIAAADDNDLLAGAQARLDRRRPVPDAPAFEARDIGDRRAAIAGAAGHDDRSRLDAVAAFRFERQGAVGARAIEGIHGGWGSWRRRRTSGPGRRREPQAPDRISRSESRGSFRCGRWRPPGRQRSGRRAQPPTGPRKRRRPPSKGRPGRPPRWRRHRRSSPARGRSIRSGGRARLRTDCRAPSRPGRRQAAGRRRCPHSGR